MNYAKETWDKLKMNLGGSVIDFEIESLAESILFFLIELFEKIEYVPNLTIAINNDLKKKNGYFIVQDEMIYIFLNSKIIKKSVKEKVCYTNELDGLFHILLHEIGHLVDMLDKFLCDKYVSLDDFFFKSWRPYVDEQEKILSELYVEEMVPLCTDCEIFANRFAFKNLPYFKSLYDFKGCTHFGALY